MSENSNASNSSPQAVTVEIYDQTYHLRGHDPEHIQRLAALVDSKMRAVAQHGTTVDSLRVAVLSALNIADELIALQHRYNALTGTVKESQSSLRNRAHSLSGLLDSVLTEERKIG
ncbi:cell division protein ZapA [Acidipila rosea]|uniref:Cell division protein ZapA n=1 Tax=Acidipila rosea TaxID=768535 RepID=A0A4R1L6E2_9BACT|nr:cell division protein ZapA [Acidipila rosea]MBW4026413.1 cell division protein ZapA [Acidobacteriota bacterium]MBW4044452.1 cell division protein ZapA [Acidobacteriota bacterium]TCK72630.1 cell division protein ZapA [Acidipila rosea]